MYLHKYIIFYYVMLNYPVPIINKSQVKKCSWSKEGHIAHFRPLYINVEPNLCMKPNINTFIILSILKRQMIT